MRLGPAILLLISIIFFCYGHMVPRSQAKLSSASCTECKAAAFTLGKMTKISFLKPTFIKLFKTFCEAFINLPQVVCDGMIDQYKDEMFYVFHELDDATKVCEGFFPECGDPSDPMGQGWEIPLPPKSRRQRAKKTRPSSSSNTTLRVLHLTDLHVDYFYQTGSEADCNGPVCCKADAKKMHRTARAAVPAGYWGTVGKCDLPYRTVEHMLRHIERTEKVDYVMIGGDIIDHTDWTYTWDNNIWILQNMSALIKSYFPTTPVYWALGNHEGVPVNNFATHFVSREEFLPARLYEQLTEMNRPWVDKESEATSLYRGSWSTLVKEGLRLISVNTGYCVTQNFFLYINQSDPDGTMTWLVKELHKSEQKGEAVHLLAHIPPGNPDCLEGWARNYYRVIQRFASTITGQFFGHVHYDFFTVFYADMKDVSSQAINVAYVAPSVTSFPYLNPAYRIYTIDATDHYKILDHENYMADLTKTSERTPPDWRLLYSAKNEYNLTSLKPEEWARVAERILSSPTMQERFMELTGRNPDRPCDSDCFRVQMCLLRAGHHDDQTYCPHSMLLTNRAY